MENDPADRISVTQLDAAGRQIEAALDLWFHEGDPVAIHTLVAAAHRVVHDIAKMIGNGPVFLNTHLLTEFGWDEGAYKEWITYTNIFFKHAQNDPVETLSFSEGQTECIFLSAIDYYRRLVHEKSPLMTLFLYWFHIHNPAFLSELSKQHYSVPIHMAKNLSRPEFFNLFW